MNSENEILQAVVEFYTKSDDFNGLPVSEIAQRFSLTEIEVKDALTSLIADGRISVNFDINPHILRFPALPADDQIERLAQADPGHICAYPTPLTLREVIEPSRYEGSPFTLRLALGEAQLEYVSFDLSVLEFYRNDPRYYYRNNDISGSIGIYDETGMLERDQVFLQTFGFSYDENYNRAVAVFLRYLSDLSPEHQQTWNAKVVHGDFKLHPDYFRSSILGEFYEGVSVFDAFTEELRIINEICELMGRPALFRCEFREGRKPKEFCFLIRPTRREFSSFVHTLDRVISENINAEFFRDDVPLNEERTRRDGKIEVSRKGTIRILDDWLKARFMAYDRTPLDEMINTFKEIRRRRQRPAHALDEDTFDMKYFQQQRELIKRAYEGIRTLRLVFMNHPKAQGYEVPDWIQTGTIRTY